MAPSTTPEHKRGSFLRIKCLDCQNEQILFNKPSTSVPCSVCGTTLAKSTGGIAKIKGEIVGVLE